MAEKYDKTVVGVLSGLFLPLVIGIIIFLFTAHGLSFGAYLSKISESGIITHAISICVFPNVAIFLLYNRFDMLRACRGVLAVTIAWAVVVFIVKFFG